MKTASTGNRPSLTPRFNEVLGGKTLSIISAVRRSPIEETELGIGRFFTDGAIKLFPYASVKVVGEAVVTARFACEEDAESFLNYIDQLNRVEHQPLKEAA